MVNVCKCNFETRTLMLLQLTPFRLTPYNNIVYGLRTKTSKSMLVMIRRYLDFSMVDSMIGDKADVLCVAFGDIVYFVAQSFCNAIFSEK